MSRPNTDYGLRLPGEAEIRTAFGSLADCVRVTGGDLPTILFYLANRDRIADAEAVAPQPGPFAADLRERALREQAAEAFDAMEKPTIIGVARALYQL